MATFLCGRPDVRKEYRHAGCGHAGMRHANVFHEKSRCSGDRPPGHAAYAPLACWRNSTKLPSPPFEAARPLRGCGYFVETLRFGASVRLRRTHPCAYGSCCFRLSRHCVAFSGDAGMTLFAMVGRIGGVSFRQAVVGRRGGRFPFLSADQAHKKAELVPAKSTA